MTLTRQSVRVDTGGPDEEGCLVFDNGRLIAVLVRLSSEHDQMLDRKWFLEHGFGELDTSEHPVFDDLGAAEGWIAARRGRPQP